MTNWERYFGTPEKAAYSLEHPEAIKVLYLGWTVRMMARAMEGTDVSDASIQAWLESEVEQ